MKSHRFHYNFPGAKKDFVISDREITHQAFAVLQLKKGEKLVFFNDQGEEIVAQISDINKQKMLLKTVNFAEGKKTESRQLTLYCSILKKDNFELMTQKAVEVGVREIFPIICQRTIKTKINSERLKKIIIAATEQSGRREILKIHEPATFVEALSLAQENAQNYFCDQSGEVYTGKATRHKIGAFVGPEGGWTPAEIIQAKNQGCKIISLGSTMLRAETAAIIAGYLFSN